MSSLYAESDGPPVELSCPDCRTVVRFESAGSWVCLEGHAYPDVEGIPVLVSLSEEATHPALTFVQDQLRRGGDLGAVAERVARIDPLTFILKNLVGTHGNLYRRVRALPRLPIAEWSGSLESGSVVVDVGGHWGRWGLAAGLKGGVPIIVDPNLEAVLTGKRIASWLGVSAYYVVGDARRLPLGSNQADVVFSYSVLQHFSKGEAVRMLREMARVAKPGSELRVQLPNRIGFRQRMNQIRQAARRDTNPFRVRFWTRNEIQETLEALCDGVSLEIDGFFTLNPRYEDVDLLPIPERWVIELSAMLDKAAQSRLGKPLQAFADSVWAKGRVAASILD